MKKKISALPKFTQGEEIQDKVGEHPKPILVTELILLLSAEIIRLRKENKELKNQITPKT